jgi:hypothetical protein
MWDPHSPRSAPSVRDLAWNELHDNANAVE